mgnify:CR=1 FL=1
MKLADVDGWSIKLTETGGNGSTVILLPATIIGAETIVSTLVAISSTSESQSEEWKVLMDTASDSSSLEM